VGLRGTRRWLDTHMVPLRDAAGRVVAALGITRDITERKRAEELLRESEERFRNIFEKHRGMMLLIDPATGAIVDANQAAAEFYGYPRSTLRTMKIQDINQLKPEEVAELLQRAVKEEQNYFIFPHRLANGDVRTVEVHNSPIELQDRTVLFSIIHDITERKRAEEAFRASEQRYRQLVEISPDAIAVHCEGKVVFVNPAMVRLIGAQNAEELLGKSVLEFVHPDDRELARRRIAQMFETGRAVPVVEECFVRLDGSVVNVEVAAVPTTYDGKPAVQVVVRDTTERKRAEELLRESEERFRTVALQTGQLVYDYNPTIGAIAWAGAIERLTGFTDEEFQGFDIQRWEEYIHPEDRQQAIQLLEQAMRGDGRYRAEYRFRRKDGSYAVVEDNGVFLFDKDRKPYRMLGTMADITERKRAETLRLRLSQVLESIASDEALPQILERLVRAIEEYQPEMKGSVLLLDADGERLRHGSAPNLPDDYNRAIDGLLIGPRAGSCGTAAYEKRLVIVEDIQTDPLWADFRDLAARHGLRACWSQPIIDHEGAVLGTLALYYQQPRKPTEAELDLINTAANIAGIAIKRKRVEEALRENEQRYRSIVENINQAYYEVDRRAIFTYCNPGLLILSGYTAEELLGTICFRLIADEDRRKVIAQYEQWLKEKRTDMAMEFRIQTKSGRIFWVEQVTHCEFDAQGNFVKATNVLRDIDERKRAEKLLRESEERFRNIFEKHRGVMLLIDPATGAIVDANQAAAEFYGYPRSTLRTMKIQDINQLKPEEVAELRQRAVKEEQNYFIFPHRLANGDVRTVEVHSSPIELQDRTVLFSIIHDITERKRAEKLLRESEERFRTVALQTGQLVYDYNPTTGAIAWAGAIERLTGFTDEEFQGFDIQRWEEYIHPEDRQQAIQLLEQAMRGDGRYRAEYRFRRKDGSYAVVEDNGVFLFDKDRKPYRMLGTMADITERKRAEDALRASEQRYRELFEESKDAVFITTPEGRFIDINPAGVELFGYSSREEMLKVDIVKDLYVNPADREQYLRALEEQGSVKNVELRLRKRTGEEIVVLETATAVRDAAGRLRALRGIMRDITLQRKLENEIRQAQKMESIGVLAGGIAHDFNNILGGILGYASYLKMKMTEEHPFYKHLETIERSALRAADLTSKLLAFARGGKYEVKPVNLNTIVNETVSLLERSLDKTITIEVVLDPHLPTVEADAGQLHQVLMNLCVNAKDAMPGGGKLLIETTHALLDEEFARTRVEARPGHFVILSVTDTGIGMDKETLLRIFDPFFTTKEKGKGTGLGLSMVYGIVKAHNGFIRVYSELGHGSTFRVYLPASDKPTEEEQQAAADMKGGTETILVVDDEDFVRELAVEVLGGAGYKVLVAANGEEALQIYQEHSSSIDLVLLDMIMPKMNGRETFAKLREVNPRVKVVLSTGYTQNGTVREILDHGALGFLQKPYRSHELLKKIRAALDQERSGE
jgi:PAS domain S-box-containing protein